MKKLLVLIFALLLVTGGATFFINKKRADTVREYIASLPGSLTAETVKADLFGSAIEIHGIKGTLTYVSDAPVEIDLAFLRIEGFNTGAGRTQGQEKLADALYYTGFTMRMPQGAGGEPLAYSEISSETSEIHGLWGDVSALAAAAESSFADDKFAEALLSLRFGSSVAKNSTFKGQIPLQEEALGLEAVEDMETVAYTATIDLCETEPYSFTDMGRIMLRGMAIVLDGKTRIDIEEMGLDSAKMAGELYKALLRGDITDPAKTPEEVLAHYAQGYKLDNLSAKKLRVTLPTGESMSAGLLACSMDIDDATFRFVFGSDAVSFPAPFWVAVTDASQEYVDLLQNRDISFSSSHDLHFKTGENNNIIATYDETVQVDELLSLKDSFALSAGPSTGPLKALPSDYTSLALTKADVEFTDKGMIFLAYSLLGLEASKYSDGSFTPEAAGNFLRAQQIGELKALPLPEGSPVAALRDNLAALLEKPGTLKATLDAEQPVQLLPMLLAPQLVFGLPIKSSYTPAE